MKSTMSSPDSSVILALGIFEKTGVLSMYTTSGSGCGCWNISLNNCEPTSVTLTVFVGVWCVVPSGKVREQAGANWCKP